MRKSKFWAVLILLCLAAVSCRQDNIFQIIASETAPRDPRIPGTPTNMVVVNWSLEVNSVTYNLPVMYVASRKLHWYNSSLSAAPLNLSKWDAPELWIPQPGGQMISALAVTKNSSNEERLYALCREGFSVNATLRYIDFDADEWTPVGPSGPIQTIFADPVGDLLFAGTGAGGSTSNGKEYTIWCYDTNNTRTEIKSNTSLLSGVVKVSNDYYLSTEGDGIYKVDASKNVTKLSGGDILFTSIIKLDNDDIIVVERRDGRLYKLDTSENSFSSTGRSTGGYATNAFASWQEPTSWGGSRKLFLVGLQGGLFTTFNNSYTYGYVEFDITDGTISAGRSPDISVRSNTSRYMATLGKHPVNHLFQAPPAIDPDMTFFAATHNKGLWSYRNRPSNGGWQWNAEE
jgi:hypothetical protein